LGDRPGSASRGGVVSALVVAVVVAVVKIAAQLYPGALRRLTGWGWLWQGEVPP
jgi:hypothetical protein